MGYFIVFLTFLTTLMLAAQASAVDLAPEGLPISGRVFLLERFIPETKTMQTGFVDITISEDTTQKLFIFHSEDSNCALLANYLNMHFKGCPYESEKPKFKNLKVGAHVRLTQKMFVGRSSIELEHLR